jgi:hypothetical protein
MKAITTIFESILRGDDIVWSPETVEHSTGMTSVWSWGP